MKISILSRSAAEKLLSEGFPTVSAVIAFYDPDSVPLDYSEYSERIFYVPLHDIDIDVLGDFGLTVESYFPEAVSLASFIHDAREGGCDIICQCEYGQSRSAACAAAIREHFFGDGIEVFADYRYYPNQLVYNKLKAELDAEKRRRMRKLTYQKSS